MGGSGTCRAVDRRMSAPESDAPPSRRNRYRDWIHQRFQRNRVTRLEATTLTEMLDRLEFAERDNDQVKVDAMLDIIGRRSFGPLLLLPGLLVLSPLSGVPGVPSLAGLMVLLLSGQLLIGRRHFWMPSWLLNRCVPHRRLQQSMRFMRPVARWIDRLLRPRLTFLVESYSVYFVAVMCALVAITMPPLELMPFAATSAGVAITAFGLALIGRDGLMALLALAFCLGCGFLLLRAFL